MAEHRAPRVGDRDDEYKARRRNLIISPERHDPFAGEILFVVIYIPFPLWVSLHLCLVTSSVSIYCLGMLNSFFSKFELRL